MQPRLSEPKRRMVRRRPALACEECRVRKRRCDGMIPVCSGCMKRRSQCIYSSEVQARVWHSSMVQSLRNRLEELENGGVRSQQLEKDNIREHSNLPRIPEPSSSQINPTSQEDVIDCIPVPRVMDSSVMNLTDAESWQFKDPTTTTSPESYPSQCLQPSRVEKLMRPINTAIGWNGNTLPVASGCTVDAVPVTAKPSTGTRCKCDQSLDTTEWCLPVRRHADRLVACFFSTVHLVYPILHRQTFMKQYKQVWASKTACSGLCKQKTRGQLFPAMMHAIFALASLFEPGELAQKAAQANRFFRLTQKIDLLDILDDEVGIELVQLGLLMGFYLQSTERFSKCWNLTGLTIRLAHNMGLHLSLDEAQRQGLLSPSATQLECEMRVRVWYACFLLDREISMSLGRSLLIATNGNKVRFPEAIDDDRLSDEVGMWNTQPKDLPSLLDSFIQTIKLYDIMGLVLDREELKESISSTSSNPATSFEDTSNARSVLGLDTKIMEWRENLPPHLQYDPSTKNIKLTEAFTCEGSAVPVGLFLRQATRLYTRFLHIRLLILRPALEQLFEKQQLNLPTANTELMEGRLQDMILSNIAAQCVHCADQLAKILDNQIQSESFVAWWYNISYLQACGSTILMGLLCSFDDTSQATKSSDIWDVCLHYLSRYTGISSIARKSFDLLQGSASHLLSNNRSADGQAQSSVIRSMDETGADKPIHARHPTGGIQRPRTQTPDLQDRQLPNVGNSQNVMQLSEDYLELDFCGEHGINGGIMGDLGLGSELWNADADGIFFGLQCDLSPADI